MAKPKITGANKKLDYTKIVQYNSARVGILREIYGAYQPTKFEGNLFSLEAGFGWTTKIVPSSFH